MPKPWCKIGDTVYRVSDNFFNGKFILKKCIVRNITCSGFGEPILDDDMYATSSFSIFKTPEEAVEHEEEQLYRQIEWSKERLSKFYLWKDSVVFNNELEE